MSKPICVGGHESRNALPRNVLNNRGFVFLFNSRRKYSPNKYSFGTLFNEFSSILELMKGATRAWFAFWGVFAVIAIATEANAQSEHESDSDFIVIIAPLEAQKEIDPLRSSLVAHLSDLNTQVELQIVNAMPMSVPEQVKAARQATEPDHILAAVWIEKTNDELYIFVSDRGSERILLQTLPHSPDGWDADCDAIATLVRSALVPWLEEKPATTPSTPQVVEGPPQPVSSSSVSARDKPTESPVRMGIVFGYALSAQKRAFGPPVHGARLGLSLRPIEYLEIDVSVIPLQPTEMDTRDADIRLIRIPVELGVTGLWPWEPIELGVRVGLVADFTHVRGIDTSESPDETDIVNIGFVPSVLFRYLPLEWLALWVDAGIYLFGRNRQYAWNDETVSTYGKAQLRLTLGVACILRLN